MTEEEQQIMDIDTDYNYAAFQGTFPEGTDSYIVIPSTWQEDIQDMHIAFQQDVVVENMDSETLKKFLMFRLEFLQEEVDELKDALEVGDTENVVDSMIDLCVVATSTLELVGVDSHKAWKEVMQANLLKRVGEKESRPNSLGFPDLVKPDGWTPPDHSDNLGRVGDAFKGE